MKTYCLLTGILFLLTPSVLLAQPGKNSRNDPPGKQGLAGKQAPGKNSTAGTNRLPDLAGKLPSGNLKNHPQPGKDSSSRNTERQAEGRAKASSSAKKPTLSEAQQQNIDKLAKDLQGLKAGSEVTPEQKQQLKNDLLAMCDNANKPSQESVQQLSQHLSAALSDKTLNNKEKAQLAQDLQAVMTSANLDPNEVAAVKQSMQTILTASNISKADVTLIMQDVQSIIAELQKNHQGR